MEKKRIITAFLAALLSITVAHGLMAMQYYKGPKKEFLDLNPQLRSGCFGTNWIAQQNNSNNNPQSDNNSQSPWGSSAINIPQQQPSQNSSNQNQKSKQRCWVHRCPYCEQEFLYNFAEHRRYCSKRPLICEFCDKGFQAFGQVVKHEEGCSERCNCKYCGKKGLKSFFSAQMHRANCRKNYDRVPGYFSTMDNEG